MNNTLRTLSFFFFFVFVLPLDPHISGYLYTHSTTAYPHLLSPFLPPFPPTVPGTSLRNQLSTNLSRLIKKNNSSSTLAVRGRGLE
jgi:hypothetical protein